ncbi:uncharacterized protein BYT42DRAFT_152531 [Radiomyces spectabilis]|uniref:uncharacterized protein n=1 Tax=Radiomyces spectabilis TaxID=64574 RepID=UPI00221E9818|nr:uncharacterized protein BYT42DRAFT_152531 [Radiomyces spectabilis]KAI8366064.1 hypothetical protein BYT42DRAFT_152531 [Radiomyces spectabilis]
MIPFSLSVTFVSCSITCTQGVSTVALMLFFFCPMFNPSYPCLVSPASRHIWNSIFFPRIIDASLFFYFYFYTCSSNGQVWKSLNRFSLFFFWSGE